MDSISLGCSCSRRIAAKRVARMETASTAIEVTMMDTVGGAGSICAVDPENRTAAVMAKVRGIAILPPITDDTTLSVRSCSRIFRLLRPMER